MQHYDLRPARLLQRPGCSLGQSSSRVQRVGAPWPECPVENCTERHQVAALHPAGYNPIAAENQTHESVGGVDKWIAVIGSTHITLDSLGAIGGTLEHSSIAFVDPERAGYHPHRDQSG